MTTIRKSKEQVGEKGSDYFGKYELGEVFKAPCLNGLEGKVTTDKINLEEIADGTVITIQGRHRAADYIIKVYSEENEKKVTIWRDPNCNGIESSIYKISTIKKEKEKISLERGVITPGKSVIMPFFNYINGKVVLTKSKWIDEALDVRMYEVEK